ncbi:MAG: hypothetical protein A2V85_14630 [Chloroflexi bacterium RBG_16_72_14]|nr:MAG: hypothetical protein A2V85_14630 [Chloroflexi bacterium RBG_16_72_14]
MAAVLFRVGLLAVGMDVVEIGLGDALVTGSLLDWALVLLVGLPLIVAGSAGFMAPLLGGPNQKGSSDA